MSGKTNPTPPAAPFPADQLVPLVLLNKGGMDPSTLMMLQNLLRPNADGQGSLSPLLLSQALGKGGIDPTMLMFAAQSGAIDPQFMAITLALGSKKGSAWAKLPGWAKFSLAAGAGIVAFVGGKWVYNQVVG